MTATGLIYLAVALAALSFLLTLSLWLRQAALLGRYRALLGGPRGEDLERLLLAHATALDGLTEAQRRTQAQLDRLEQASLTHVQRVGVVRFNAFPDAGSDLSFAIALLDGKNDGLVLTSLFARSESRIYAKPIRAGQSSYHLTDEEKEALARAMGAGSRAPAPGA